MSEAAAGTAWMCDGKGRIIEVLRDDLNICLGVDKGAPFSSIVAAASADKAQDFVETLLSDEAVFGWQLDVIFADRLTPMHFAGGVTDDYLMIMASLTEPGVRRLNKALLGTLSSPSEPAVDLHSALEAACTDARRLRDGIGALKGSLSGSSGQKAAELSQTAEDLQTRLEAIAAACAET